jgi:hypothetical protein
VPPLVHTATAVHYQLLVALINLSYRLFGSASSRFKTALPTTMTPTQFVDKLNTNTGSVLSSADRTTANALFGGARDSSNATARVQALRQVAEHSTLVTMNSTARSC